MYICMYNYVHCMQIVQNIIIGCHAVKLAGNQITAAGMTYIAFLHTCVATLLYVVAILGMCSSIGILHC